MIPGLRTVQYARKVDGGQLLSDAFAAGEQVCVSRASLIRGPSQEFQYMFMSNKDAHFRADGSSGSRPLQRDDLIPSQNQRSGNENRRVCPENDTDGQGEREVLENTRTEDQKRYDHE